jgi:hypothetical protein
MLLRQSYIVFTSPSDNAAGVSENQTLIVKFD